VVGNQVIFADILYNTSYRKSPRNIDSWDGFPAEKKRVSQFIHSNKIQDLIFVTGDSHASWAIEVATDVDKTYDPNTSKGAFAIEFGTTSISSGNSDERYPVEQVKAMEADILKLNPHVKYVNDRDHGYLLLTLYADRALGEWYYMETIREPQSNEFLGKKAVVTKGSVQLK
jgi:alkaline phosphatase D